ncbi:LysM peptidoglycan-binding domain-containing protein [Streptomyces lunaelactis]|uniref:LysM peptidoglycan-binding domain-containing protein n=1 Tax=Streptomyces lunaelactis TaxID=1535768 RepID=UPI001584A834|nr:transglycosylase family protein [Streptomyces lunaelactis]NUK01588.1 transglycosylase family protein [Streptomyces lunaelactis]NUK16882.1 transglycosylase family protein [Streptomyces lunaelactis]NUK22731.1 transglycosylase family protein [Streptomyces lunaelactis]NUK58747.1 transglycosylase family protein [Streptomyces lunaelactis]
MRSGNGRHRRPRQAPAIVVAAGVTGSAIAIPLLGAGSASAADAATWDRVAECESGGMWSADLGNGYYGGLQFSPETWQDFGGTAYAPSADLASRSQQIAVAEKVLDAQGPGEWAGCAALAGLTNDGAATGVDPGAMPTPGQGAPTEPAAPTTPPSAEPSRTAKDSKPATATPDSAEAGADANADSGNGKHRGTPGETAEPGNTDNERETGRHASRGDGAARDGAGSTDETGEAGKAGNADAAPGDYTVRAGDSLWSIVDEQKLPGGWSALYKANEKAIGGDPDLILPGQSLDLGRK